MTPHEKIGYILLALMLTAFPKQTQAQAFDIAELGVQAIAGGAGYAIGKAFHSNTGAAIGAGLGPVIAEMGYTAFKNKANRDKLDSFMAGQDYSAGSNPPNTGTTSHWIPTPASGKPFGTQLGPGRAGNTRSSRGTPSKTLRNS